MFPWWVPLSLHPPYTTHFLLSLRSVFRTRGYVSMVGSAVASPTLHDSFPPLIAVRLSDSRLCFHVIPLVPKYNLGTRLHVMLVLMRSCFACFSAAEVEINVSDAEINVVSGGASALAVGLPAARVCLMGSTDKFSAASVGLRAASVGLSAAEVAPMFATLISASATLSPTLAPERWTCGSPKSA